MHAAVDIARAMAGHGGEPVLFYSPGACSLASHIALEETGLPYRPIEVLLSAKQHLTPQYLAINPRGQVPALMVQGQIITENTAILTYIGMTHPQAGLLPDDPIARAQVISRMAWLSNTPHISQRAKVRPYRFADDTATHAAISAKGNANFWENLQELDALAEGRQWLMGETYTVADPYALLFYCWGLRNGLPMETLKALTRLKQQMLARPAVQTVLRREKNILVAAGN